MRALSVKELSKEQYFKSYTPQMKEQNSQLLKFCQESSKRSVLSGHRRAVGTSNSSGREIFNK